jgi:hypothetical protein
MMFELLWSSYIIWNTTVVFFWYILSREIFFQWDFFFQGGKMPILLTELFILKWYSVLVNVCHSTNLNFWSYITPIFWHIFHMFLFLSLVIISHIRCCVLRFCWRKSWHLSQHKFSHRWTMGRVNALQLVAIRFRLSSTQVTLSLYCIHLYWETPFALPSWFATFWSAILVCMKKTMVCLKKPMGISAVWIRPDVRNPWKRLLQSAEQQVRMSVSKFTPWQNIHPKQISENSYERLKNKFAAPVPRGIAEQMNCSTEMAELETQLLCISCSFSVRDTATKCAADLGTILPSLCRIVLQLWYW